MHTPEQAHAELHHLRADLWELSDWAEDQLSTDRDRQYIAEHLTSVLDALLRYAAPPPRPF